MKFEVGAVVCCYGSQSVHRVVKVTEDKTRSNTTERVYNYELSTLIDSKGRFILNPTVWQWAFWRGKLCDPREELSRLARAAHRKVETIEDIISKLP